MNIYGWALNVQLNSNFHGVIVPFSDPIMYHCKQHLAECIGLISEESISHQATWCHHFHVFLHHWYWMKSLTKAPRILEPKTQTLLWSTNPPKFTSPSRTFPWTQSHGSTCSVSVSGHLIIISDFLVSFQSVALYLQSSPS